MKRGNLTILASVLMMMLVAVAVGAGTMAYFSETETVGITFKAGDPNLKLSLDGETWYNSLSIDTIVWSPGDTYAITVWLKNIGDVGLENLFVAGGNLAGDPDKSLSDVINITDVAYTDRDLDGSQMWVHPAGGHYYETVFGDTNAPLTLRELCNDGYDPKKMSFCWGTPGVHGDYLPADGGRVQGFYIEFAFDEDAGNEYQGKTVSFDLVFRGTDEPGTFVWWPGM